MVKSTTTFGILELGTLHGNHHFSLMPSKSLAFCWHSYSWFVCLPSWVGSLLSAGWELVEGRNWFITVKTKKKKKKKKKAEFSALSFVTLCWAVKCGQSCMQMNGGKLVMHPETDVVVNFHWPHLMSPTLAWLSCQSWYVLTADYAPQHQRDRDWVRERLLKAKTHSFIQIWSSVFGYSKCMGFEQLHERGLFCMKNKLLFSAYLQPLVCFVFLQWCCICRENNHLSDMPNV